MPLKKEVPKGKLTKVICLYFCELEFLDFVVKIYRKKLFVVFGHSYMYKDARQCGAFIESPKADLSHAIGDNDATQS